MTKAGRTSYRIHLSNQNGTIDEKLRNELIREIEANALALAHKREAVSRIFCAP
jgi:hypothetical protein